MKRKHPGGRPPSKHPPLATVSFKIDKEIEDALELIRKHLSNDKPIGALEANKSFAFRYAVLATKKAIEDSIAKGG